MTQLVKMAMFYRKGMAPVAGGVLDQAAGFVEACDLIWRDEADLRIRLKIPEVAGER